MEGSLGTHLHPKGRLPNGPPTPVPLLPRRSWRRCGAGRGPVTCGRWTGMCGAGRGFCCPVDLEGRVCQPLTTHVHWEPTTRAIQVLQDLLLQLDSPDPQRMLRLDVARELQERPEEFRRRAEEHSRLHAEPRPDP
ncbi:ubiquitin/ISG15-conjugating enzyme E2 L6 isoform X2 [Cinclus cinclus]|uniref:ubiquitin/ISG15-conjugating enzyme E2 L6 isoform X2 n=1 Tax=Cinclus cinclus TaxID=127875 RepID=UPI002E147626